MEGPKQLPQPDRRVVFDMSLPDNAPIKRGGNTLLIALVTSAVLLLAAAGVAGWTLYQNMNAAPATKQPKDTSSTKNVKNISWVAPATPGFTARVENTVGTLTTYYLNPETGCTFTTNVSRADVVDGATTETAVINLLKTQDTNITLDSAEAGKEVTILDAEGKEYPFQSLTTEQTIAVPATAYSRQSGLTIYKQFGQHVASLMLACNSDVWAAQQSAMEQLIATFTVKVET